MTASAEQLTVGHDRISFQLTSAQTEGEVAVFDATIPPGGGPPLLHRHDPFELYRVRRGELAIYLEQPGGAVTRRIVGPGAVVPIAGGLEHTIRNESDAPADATVVFLPGGPMERFARAAAGARDPDAVLALAQAHGIEITRPIDAALATPGSGLLTIARFPGDGDRLVDEYREYADAMSDVGRDHGLILHAGAKTDDGFLVVNVWPSREASEAAARDPRRLAVLANAAIDPGEIRREHHEVVALEVFA